MSGRLLLKMATTISCLECTQRNTFGPIVDGYVVPDQPYQLLRAGKLNPAAILTGSNRGEGTIVIGLAPMLWAGGVGAEVIKPMAAPVLGGVLIADEVIDLLLPVAFYWVRLARLRRLERNSRISLY